MITITLENQDQFDLFVSVTDLNQAGSPAVVDKKRLNVGASMLVDVQEDSHDSGRIIWNAQRVDKPSKAAQRKASPSSGDTVEVTTQFE